jgi:hypothetical protein
MSRKKPRTASASDVAAAPEASSRTDANSSSSADGNDDSASAISTWLVPLLGVCWAAWNLRGGYFFYDDWAMIDRVLHTTPVEGMTTGYNGHLWILQDWVYRIQVFWFGVDDNTFIRGVFLCALLVLHLSLASLLRASGLSRASSTMLGGLLTYLGAGAENFMWPVQLSATLSVAAGVAAAAIALRRMPPATAHIAAVGVLSLLSVGLDSAIAFMSVTLAAVVTLLAWRGIARLAVVPAIVALGLWTFLADRGPSFPADAATRAAFAVRLVLHASGGVFGLGPTAGAIALIIALALIGIGFHKGYLDRRSRIMLAAGSAAALVVVAALTVARAGIAGLDFTNGSRYLHNVIIPMTLAAAPALAATGRGLALRSASDKSGRASRPRRPTIRRAESPPALALLGLCLIVAAFILGLAPKERWAPTFRRYNAETRAGLASAAVVIRLGCPSGAQPDAASTPLDFIGPQVPTRLIRELLDRGLLDAPPPMRPDPAIVARMCRP